MKVLIVGSGGREHAIATSVAKSTRVSKIYCAPGNAGIGQIAECVAIGAMEFEKLVAFAKELMEVLQEVSNMYPLHPMTQSEKAELTTQIQMCYLDELMGTAKLLKGEGCRIFVQYDSELVASPLYRTLIVKAVKRSELISVIRPFRSYLQSVGLACGKEEIAELSRLLLAIGRAHV